MTLSQVAPGVAVAIQITAEFSNVRFRRTGATNADRGTVWVIQLLITLGLFAAFVLPHRQLPPALRFPSVAGALGIVVTLIGAGIRIWAIRVLGTYFTRAVHVSPDQPVVEAGPYRLIRHPSYTGSLIEFLGVGIALGNWASLACAFVVPALALAIRIRVEEQALVSAIGEPYRAYQTRTKRLIPYVI